MFNRASISLLLLLAGALIYATCRQEVLFLMPISPEWLAKIKIEVDYANCDSITSWVIFCLPDALWYMALLVFQLGLCSEGFLAKIVFGASIALPFVLEVSQKYGVMPGTFDWFDILIYLLTFAIFVLCQQKRLKQLYLL